MKFRSTHSGRVQLDKEMSVDEHQRAHLAQLELLDELRLKAAERAHSSLASVLRSEQAGLVRIAVLVCMSFRVHVARSKIL